MSNITDIMGYESPFGENSLFASPAEPEKWLYRVIQSTDGSELINHYLKYDYAIEEAKGISNADRDFLIYIEIPAEEQLNIDLNRVVLTKMSRLFREYLITNQTFIPLIADEIARRENSKYKLTKEELSKAFELELKYRSSKDNEFLGEMYTENELAETFLDAVSDGFRGLKIPEEYWNPDLKSKKYLGPEKFINTAVQKLQKLYQTLKAIKGFLAKNKDNLLARNLVQFIDSAMKDIASMIQWLLKLKKLTQVQFAFLCGMVNGCMEFLAGIVDMVVLAIKIRNQMANGTITGELELDMMAVTESVEFLIEQYIKDPDFLKKQMAEAMKGYVETRYNPSLSRYVIAHNAGEDTIIAIDIVLSVITIVKGVGKLSTKLSKFNKWIDDILARNGKGARKIQSSLLKRGKYLGQALEESDLIKVEKFLVKNKVDLQIGPSGGAFQVEGFFYPSGKVFEMSPKNAALFITDGKKMKLVIREDATIYELLHELMHYRDCKATGMKSFMQKPLVNREKFVYDKMVEHSKYLNRKELIHAEDYINKHYKDFGVTDASGNPVKETLPFDLKDIPKKRQEVNIDKILNLK